MARELSIDLEVNPTLNAQATRNLINTLEKEIRSVKSGQHLPLARKASSVMEKWVESGFASTPTQARMILSDMMGGGFTAQQKAVLRSAQNITSSQLYLQRATRAEQQKIGAFSARAAYLQNQYQAFQQEPTSEIAVGLLTGLTGIRRELLKLYQEYRVNRRQVPPILRQIAQNTSSMRREVSDWEATQEKPRGGGNDSINLIKSAAKTLATLAGIKQIKDGFLAMVERGNQALKTRAAYGSSINWKDVRTRAALFNMPVEEAMEVNKYGSDFQQRMMWGEVSEREIIGLSRAGRWGKMVMSGEAARNPEAANQAFEELVTATDEAKMRSILRQLGLSQGQMSYNLQAYSPETRKEYAEKFGAIADAEEHLAAAVYDVGNQLELLKQELQAVTGISAYTATMMSSPQARETTRNLGYYAPSNEAVKGIKKDIAKELAYSFVPRPIRDAQNNISQIVNNQITINGNVDMDNVDSITEKMSAELAKSNYDAMANAIGARTSF